MDTATAIDVDEEMSEGPRDLLAMLQRRQTSTSTDPDLHLDASLRKQLATISL